MPFLLLIFLAFAFQLMSIEPSSDLIPVSYEGRFIPLKNLKDDAPKKILPSKSSPLKWEDVEILKNEKNKTLFKDEEFLKLQKIYQEEGLSDLFAKEYFKAYLPHTDKKYHLSKIATLSFPSIYQLKAEVIYTNYSFLSIGALIYLFALFFFLLGLYFEKLNSIGFLFFILAFVIHTLTLLLRVYILERPPVSNMGETLIYVPWVTSFIAVIAKLLIKSSYPQLAAAFLAVILLTLLEWTLGAPSLSNVQPVLNSRFWLTIHVLMIVGSYGIFLLAGLLGHIYFILNYLRKDTKTVSDLILKFLYIGVALLVPGTILGGVWAAQSWGRFWDWDPKESWAFISIAFYLLTIHAHRFGLIRERGLAVGSIVGLIAISFTWYGVNYILGTGLHSYGFGTGGEWIYYTFVGFELLFLTTFHFLTNRSISYTSKKD